MNPIIRNILGLVVGIIAGGALNMGIVMLSNYIVPLPEGVDATNMESLSEGMHLFGPQHFLMPFLAHTLGTLLGAFLAARIAATKKMVFALAVGVFFLAGGVQAVIMLPAAPLWFKVTDLVLAYIPMGWLGAKLAGPGTEVRFPNRPDVLDNK